MEKPKADVLIAMFCYAGNGGVATILPEIGVWLAKVNHECKTDDRIGRIGVKRYGDIPLTMERNRVVRDAIDGGFDIIVMLDSDNIPDLYLGHDPQAQPFFESSFDFVYERLVRNLPTVVCSPYCGPPPHPVSGGMENVYVFDAVTDQSDDKRPDYVDGIRIEAYSRDHAAVMNGIKPVAAGPTGVIMYSTSAFELMPAHGMTDEDILHAYARGELTTERTRQLLRMESYFWYEFTDRYQTRKASTEDVTNTREIGLMGQEKHGEPVVFCNWDAWAGHGKPRVVGKPIPIRTEQVSNLFAESVRKNISVLDEGQVLDFDMPETKGQEAHQLVSETLDRQEAARDAWNAAESDKVDANPDYQAAADGALVKERILGEVFENPRFGERECRLVRDICEMNKARRSLVMGDVTGEVCHSLESGDCETVYSTEKNGHGRVLGKVNPPETHLQMAQRYEKADIDLLVICADAMTDPVGACHWFPRHVVDPGGVMMVMSQSDTVLESISDAVESSYTGEYDVRMLPEFSAVCFEKVHVVARNIEEEGI